MTLCILLALFFSAVLGWIVTKIIPSTRENGIHLYFLIAIALLNLVIQVVCICTN